MLDRQDGIYADCLKLMVVVFIVFNAGMRKAVIEVDAQIRTEL